jgi:hypothetical protein
VVRANFGAPTFRSISTRPIRPQFDGTNAASLSDSQGKSGNMASPGKPTGPTRTCDKCTAEMTHLADLPAYQGRDAIRVFRCYVCNNVVSEKN